MHSSWEPCSEQYGEKYKPPITFQEKLQCTHKSFKFSVTEWKEIWTPLIQPTGCNNRTNVQRFQRLVSVTCICLAFCFYDTWYITIPHSVTSFIRWLAPRAGKMNQIARCDWLPRRTRWSHLARSGLPTVSRVKNFPESHVINPLLTKFVRSRWLDIGLVLFLRVYGPWLRLSP